MKLYFYEDEDRFVNNSHLTGKTFFSLVHNSNEADFLFVPQQSTDKFFNDTIDNKANKKIVYFNLTEPISFNSAKWFLERCIQFGIDSKDVLFHCTNHYLDNFNCIGKGLSIVDHIVKSQLDDGVGLSEKFLKFTFINNTVRRPRALVLDELLSRNLFLNQTYTTCNTDKWYGNKNILKYPHISKWFEQLKSADYLDVQMSIPYKNDKDFQLVFKTAFFNFVIETFSEFSVDNGGFNSHLTEKTIRNFIYKTPFLLLTSSEQQINVIKSLGFETYNHIFDFKIDTKDINGTIKKYVDIMESFSNVSTNEIRRFCETSEVLDIVDKNYNRIKYYMNLDIENIYRYILNDEYQNMNETLLSISEPNNNRDFSILSNI